VRVPGTTEIIDNVLPHIPKVTNVRRGESVDFGEIDRSAKSERQNPVSQFDQFVRGNDEEMALGVKGKDRSATLRGRAGSPEYGGLMLSRCRHASRLRDNGLCPLYQALERHKALLAGRHNRS
jgi:hypothetical protein